MTPAPLSDFVFSMLINATLLLAIMQLWMLSQSRAWPGSRWMTLLLPSVAGLLVMRSSAVLVPGVIFDTRSVVLTMSGVFLGPLPTVLAMAVTAAYRLHLGGIATGVGIGVIATSGLAGIAFGALWRRPLKDLNWRQLYPLGIAVHVAMLAWMTRLPSGLGTIVVSEIAWPVLVIHPLLTLALGMIMVDSLRRQEDLHALQARESLYGELFRGSRAVMLLVSEENDAILDANRSAETFYGWSRSELLAKCFADLDASGDAMQAYVAVEGRMGQPWLHRFELRHKRADRSIRDVEVFHTRIYVDRRPALFLILHDISDRLTAERSLQELERLQREDHAQALSRQEQARLHAQGLMEAAVVASKNLEQSLAMNQALISSSPLPVLSTDLQGIVVGWNRAAERVFGWTAQEAVGQVNPLVPPDKSEDFQALREKLGQGEVFVGIERERICKDGRRVPVSIYAAPIVDSSGAILGIVATVEDISARKAAEAEVAIQAQRAQSLLALPQAAEQLSEGDFLQKSLGLTEELTGSAIAFVHFVQPNQGEVELGAWSAQTLEDYCRASHDSHYPVQKAGIWIEPLRTHKPFVLNNYPASTREHKVPEGHPHLQRLVVVPVLEQGQVVMLMGLGNRADDYRDWEVESVQLMADATWRLVQARRSVASMEAEVLERRRVEAQLRKLALAVEQSPDSIVITDVNAVIDYVNEAFVAASGFAREEVIGQNPRFQHSGHTPPETFAEMWATLTAGNSWDGEFYNRRRNGEIFIERAIIAPLRQPDGAVSHYVAIKHDVTQARLEAEELEQHRLHLEELVDERTLALNSARLQAENASRAKSAFLANMSHEIRTPMNAILGLVQLLQREVEAPHLTARLEKVAGAARHLLAIINDILDLSKIEAGRLDLELSEFSVQEVMNHVAAMVADSAAAKGLRLTVADAGPLPWVRGDVTRVRQALLNYAGNAVKFTNAGFVELSAAVRPMGDGRVEVRMDVADSGIGLTSEQMSKLFTPFEQADPSLTRQFGGTGLGLAITRSLALMMGGDTGCSSVAGEGSQFWFTFHAELVAVREPPPQPALKPKRSAHLRESGAQLLLVEDNEINREVALELLRGEGLEVTVAVDGQEAVEHVAARPFDLVLMDVQMPRMDGLAATQAIRQMPGREGMPIVAMTANAFAQDRAACMAAGMNDFVAKPFEIEELTQVLERWLPSGPRLSNQVEATAQDPRDLPQWQRWTALPGVEPPSAVIRRLPHWQSYETLLRQFAARHGSTGAEGWALLQADDLQGLRQLAHSVKGAALTLGIRTVGQSAAAVEMASAQGLHWAEASAEQPGLNADIRTELQQKFAALEHDLGAFAGAVQALPERVDAAEQAQGQSTAPDSAEVERVIDVVEQLLRLFDTQVWNELQEHRDILKGYLGLSFQAFADALGRADFAAALQTLNHHKKERGQPHGTAE